MEKAFSLVETNIKDIERNKLGIKVFNNIEYQDNRGILNISYEGRLSGGVNSLSIKESFSKPYSARGMHHQKRPFGQQKIISVEKGSILDFVFDTEQTERILYFFQVDDSMKVNIYLPDNLAHGFITLTEVKFRYLCVGEYSEPHETTYNVFPSVKNLLNLDEITQSNKDSLFPNIEVFI